MHQGWSVMYKYYFITMQNGLVAPGICYSGPLPVGAVACTQEQYSNSAYYTLKEGAIIASTPPTLSLQTQAQTLLKTQQSYIMQAYTVYGDETPSEWVSYLKALRAIAGGADTTSTSLPTPPAVAA